MGEIAQKVEDQTVNQTCIPESVANDIENFKIEINQGLVEKSSELSDLKARIHMLSQRIDPHGSSVQNVNYSESMKFDNFPILNQKVQG